MKAVVIIFAVLCGAAVLAYLISEIKEKHDEKEDNDNERIC